MTVVLTLRASPERACGTFPVDVAPSTLTHHFRVLREAGIIRQREDGNRRWTTLRDDELDARFPGLIDAIVTAYVG
jgi:DNA-binding transcriptional ArsR family regulator